VVGFNSKLFADIVVDTKGQKSLGNLIGQLGKLENQVTSVSQALSKMSQMQSAFQKQTMPDITGGKGQSIFAGPEGGKRQAGRAMSPLNDALQEAQSMSAGAAEGMRRYKMTTNAAGERVMQFMGSQERLNQIHREAQEAAGGMGEQFGENFGKYMNLMFAGMALNMVLGGMRRKMMKMTGASAALGAAMKSTLLPVFLALNPVFLEFSNFLINLPPIAKMAVGVLFMLTSALALLMLIGGQAGLFWQSWGDAMKGAASSARGKMGPALGMLKSGLLRVAGALKTAITSTLTYVGAALTSAIAATWSWVAANSALLLTLGSIALTVGSLVLGLFLLQRIFKKFGPVVGMIATILGSSLLAVLSPIAAVVMSIFGAFKAVNKIFKKFGKVVGLIAGVIVAIIGGLIAVFASIPIGIGLAIGAVLAIIWNFRDEIVNAIKGAIKWVLSLPKKFAEMKRKARRTILRFASSFAGWIGSMVDKGIDKLKDIISFFGNLGSKITNAVGNAASWLVDIGEDMIQGLIDGIKSMGSMITDAIAGLLPEKFKKALNEAAEFGSEALNAVTSVLTPNDFILTSGGKMIQPAANDTIVGFNGNGPIQPGAGGETNITINDPVVREEKDLDRIVDMVEERIDRDTRGRSGGIT
jgi:phage-related protein